MPIFLSACKRGRRSPGERTPITASMSSVCRAYIRLIVLRPSSVSSNHAPGSPSRSLCPRTIPRRCNRSMATLRGAVARWTFCSMADIVRGPLCNNASRMPKSGLWIPSRARPASRNSASERQARMRTITSFGAEMSAVSGTREQSYCGCAPRLLLWTLQGGASGQRQCHSERLVEGLPARGSEAGDVVGQHRLRQADESIAVDAGFMLEAVFDAHVDLRRQIVATGVDGGADHGREQRIDQSLAAHDDEDSGPLRVSPPWVPDAEEVAALQTSA